MISLLRSKTFWINIGLGLIFLLFVLFITMRFIDMYTNHGEKLEVPKVTGMRIDKAQQVLTEKKMRWEIIDSVYMPEQAKMVVTEQDPAAGSAVKSNRIIYLVINSRNAPVVEIPNLYGKSQKQAQLTLEGLGFNIGEVSYKPDEVDGALQELTYKGRRLTAGEKLEKGSVIDLVVGKNEDADTTNIDGTGTIK